MCSSVYGSLASRIFIELLAAPWVQQHHIHYLSVPVPHLKVRAQSASPTCMSCARYILQLLTSTLAAATSTQMKPNSRQTFLLDHRIDFGYRTWLEAPVSANLSSAASQNFCLYHYSQAQACQGRWHVWNWRHSMDPTRKARI